MKISDMKPFGIINMFKNLCWETALKCYDRESKVLYMDIIQERVSTLKVEWGNNAPKTMRLIGWVNNKEAMMFMENLRHIDTFDSNPSGECIFPLEMTFIDTPKNSHIWDEEKWTIQTRNGSWVAEE